MKMKNTYKKHSLKFISLFISLLLWGYVLNSEKIRFEKVVLLEYILPEDMIFAQRPVSEVTFLIEGPRAFVRTVVDREDRIVLDLNKANIKRQLSFNLDIAPSQLNLPFGMAVERIIPKRIQIRLEKKASKIIPIKPQFLGALPDKLSMLKMELVPSEVEVYGPRSLISELKSLPTRPIDLENLVGQDNVPVEIFLADDRLSLNSGSEVSFKYVLKALNSNLTLENLPIKFLSHNKNIDSKIKLASLRLLVPEKVTKNRSNISSSIQVWADIPENAKGRVEVPLKVMLPPSIHLIEVSPKSIIVNLR